MKGTTFSQKKQRVKGEREKEREMEGFLAVSKMRNALFKKKKFLKNVMSTLL